MSTPKNTKDLSKEDAFDKGTSRLENMWDEMLNRGDDDFHEAFRQHSSSEDKEVRSRETHRPRKRGRRI